MHVKLRWVCWHMPIIPTLGSWKEEDKTLMLCLTANQYQDQPEIHEAFSQNTRKTVENCKVKY